ncbi:MAG: RHS repeat-associated core domain-containing protein [Fimbriimonadaceae bacterium]|nr:MAG: RHS repeat-associated core domain-containing protein [Fimbriimonadaceae bacterium]
MSRGKRYSEDQIIKVLQEIDAGASIASVARSHGITEQTLNGTTQNYVVDDADKLISITQGGNTVKSFTYDAAGRTTAVTVGNDTTRLDYDYESRITQITCPDQSTNTFAYNGLDTRVSKVDSTGTRTYLRDGAYVTDPVHSDGEAVYTPGISERRSSVTKFYHPDRLGTTERLTDTNQSTTDTRQYDAFGLLTSSSGSTSTPFGFAGAWGYQEDPDSGLKLLGHRYYDPSTGRFLTRDPVKDGRNWYGYCGNNPLKWADPEGLSEKGDAAARRADDGMDKLPKDCEDWIRKWVYPDEWPNGRAHQIPDALRKRKEKDWEEVPNDGRLQPGDLIVMQPLYDKDGKETKPGHVIVVGDGYVDGERHPNAGTHNELQDASLGKREGTRKWIPAGGPYKDSKGRPVSIWRPRDKKK